MRGIVIPQLVGVNLVHKDAKYPTKGHKSDACYDLYCVGSHTVTNAGLLEYDTGISLDIPEGYVGLIFPRSSITKTNLSLANSVGVIDSGYKDTVKFRFRYNESDVNDVIYNDGERIGQLMVIPIGLDLDIPEVEDDGKERGMGGFGSTGL